MLWAKVLVPAVLATTGLGAGVAAAVLPDHAPAATGPARAWIDSPLPGAAFGPGPVPVDAHAADPSSAIATLELVVDGDVVARDDDLDRTEDLVFATFEWDAEVGVHELVVREPGDDATSPPRTVVIGDGMAPAPVRPGGGDEVAAGATTTTPPDPASSSTEPTTTTTNVGPDDTTTTEGAATSTTAPSGTATTSTTAPAGTEPATPPEILRAVVTPSPGTLYTLGCGYTVDVAVAAVGAEAVTVSVDGTSFFQQMSRSGDDYQLTLSGGSQWNGAAGSHTVTVVAGNGESTVTAVAGTVVIDDRVSCPKD